MILLFACLFIIATVKCDINNAIITNISYNDIISKQINDIKLINLTNDQLSHWYDPLAKCMIQSSNTQSDSYWTILETCKLKIKSYKYADGFLSLPSSAYANKLRGICCNEEVKINERGFNQIIEGYENKYNSTLELLLLLSMSNRSLILLGDSVNVQVYHALLADIDNENIGGRIEPIYKLNRWWNNNYYYKLFGLSEKAINFIQDIVCWYPPMNGANPMYIINGIPIINPVYLYQIHIYFYDGSTTENMLTNSLIPLLNSIDHPDGLVILANIGHHLSEERKAYDRRILNYRISLFLNWLHSLQLQNPKTIASFLETTPAHFNSPDLDGSYEKYKLSSRSYYDYTQPNDWDHTLYYCRAINNLSNRTLSQTPENNVAYKILNIWKETNITIFPMFKYIAPYDKMKYGNCGGFDRISVIDCVHFCSYAPTMWIPIWYEISNLLKIRYQYEFNQSNSYIASNTNSSLKETINILKYNTIVNDIKIIKHLNNTLTNYILYHGLKRRFIDFISLEKTLHLKITANTFIYLSDDIISYIPEGFEIEIIHFTNGELVKTQMDASIYLIDDGKRRVIPNWETFVNMKLDLSNVKTITQVTMNMIPVGEDLPSLQ